MRYKASFVALLFLAMGLSACDISRDSGKSIAADLKENALVVNDTLVQYFTKRPAPPSSAPLKTSYCYRSFQDISCYAKPMPGQQNRLVGWQGDNVWGGSDVNAVFMQEAAPVADVIVSSGVPSERMTSRANTDTLQPLTARMPK